jgi:hypothetical protein
MTPEKQEQIDALNETRDKVCEIYANSEKKVDEGFVLIGEFKDEIDKVKGYTGLEFVIDKSKVADLKKELVKLYSETRSMILDSNLHPVFVEANYQVGHGDGFFVDDPDHSVLRFVLELNKGDYKAMASPLANKEEDAMRGHKSTEELRKSDDDEVESRLNSLIPGAGVIKNNLKKH